MNTPSVHVQILKPFPSTVELDALWVNPLQQELSITRQLPGDGATCRVGIAPIDAANPAVYPTLPRPVMVERKCQVLIRLNGRLVFRGRVNRVSARRDGFEAQGLGLEAVSWCYLEHGLTTEATSGDIISGLVDDNPWLTMGRVADTGVRHALKDHLGVSLAEFLDIAIKEGDDQGISYSWTVNPAMVFRFFAQGPPASPNYLLAYDPATMQIDYVDEEPVDKVRVRYTDSDNVERLYPESDWQYQPDVDQSNPYLIPKQLRISGSITSAAQLAETYLAQHRAPLLAGTISIPNWGVLTTPGNGRRRAYLAEPGQSFEIRGYGSGYLTNVTIDGHTGLVDLTLGNPVLGTLARLISDVAETDIALRTKRDPLSGNRLILGLVT